MSKASKPALRFALESAEKCKAKKAVADMANVAVSVTAPASLKAALAGVDAFAVYEHRKGVGGVNAYGHKVDKGVGKNALVDKIVTKAVQQGEITPAEILDIVNTKVTGGRVFGRQQVLAKWRSHMNRHYINKHKISFKPAKAINGLELASVMQQLNDTVTRILK